jgi:hypothetical protein
MNLIGAVLLTLGAVALLYALAQKLADTLCQRELRQLRNWKERQR